MRNIIRGILFILLTICLFSCNNSTSKDSNNLTLGVMSSMDYLPLAVAQKEGYFEKVGLNIKLQKFYSANERDAAFQSNNIDGTIIDFTGAILQRSGGIDLKLTSKCDAPFYIVANTTINNLSELRGKQIAVSRNTVIDFIVDKALESAGLTSFDIEKVEINKIPVRFEMLMNNKIDATGLPNPFALMASQQGDRILTSNDNLGFNITGIMFHQNVINNKPEEITKLYEAYNMGVDYLKNHSAQDISSILVKEFGFPANLIDSAQLPQYTYAELPTQKDITLASDWLLKKDLIKAPIVYSDIIDSTFIK